MSAVPYEVLIRLRNGQAFAQAQTLTSIDGREIENLPVPLDLAGPEFESFKTAFNATVLGQRDSLALQLSQLNDKYDEDVTQLQQAIQSLIADNMAITNEKSSLQSQVASLQAEIELLRNPPLNRRKIVTWRFVERLTRSEQIAITLSDDVDVAIIEKRLLARAMIELDSQRTRDSLDYFVSKGLIAESRLPALLADATDAELSE